MPLIFPLLIFPLPPSFPISTPKGLSLNWLEQRTHDLVIAASI